MASRNNAPAPSSSEVNTAYARVMEALQREQKRLRDLDASVEALSSIPMLMAAIGPLEARKASLDREMETIEAKVREADADSARSRQDAKDRASAARQQAQAEIQAINEELRRTAEAAVAERRTLEQSRAEMAQAHEQLYKEAQMRRDALDQAFNDRKAALEAEEAQILERVREAEALRQRLTALRG